MKKVDPRKLEARFWRWRHQGRESQTLYQDLEMFLTAWQSRVGWQVCSEVWKSAIGKLSKDVFRYGGRPPKGGPWDGNPAKGTEVKKIKKRGRTVAF